MAEIDRDAIAARAYALYVRGGRRPGRAQDDWFEAERQLKAEQAAPSSLAVVAPAAKTLVPGAPAPASKLALVTPPPSAPAVPAAHAEAAKATAPKAAAPTKAAPAAPAAKPAPAPSKGSGSSGGGGSGKKNRHKRR